MIRDFLSELVLYIGENNDEYSYRDRCNVIFISKRLKYCNIYLDEIHRFIKIDDSVYLSEKIIEHIKISDDFKLSFYI